jgi:hypothetical protein
MNILKKYILEHAFIDAKKERALAKERQAKIVRKRNEILATPAPKNDRIGRFKPIFDLLKGERKNGDNKRIS